MALVLNTNSYVEIADADDYLETRIDSANWFDADDEIKEQAIVTATLLIDDNSWIGSAVSSSQALAWPRKNAIYNDSRLGMTITIAENEVPSRVKVAIYEQALHLIDNEDLLMGTLKLLRVFLLGQCLYQIVMVMLHALQLSQHKQQSLLDLY